MTERLRSTRQKDGKEKSDSEKKSHPSADDMENIMGFRPYGYEW
jgi:hypothetical protein